MNHDGFEHWMKTGKSWMGPLAEWNKVSTDMMRKLAQQNMELIGENFSRMSDQLKRLSSAKRPEDFINVQRDCLNEDLSAAMESVHKMIHTTMENMEEFTRLCHTTTTRETATKQEREKVVK